MKRHQSKASKITATTNGLLPNSIRFISSCIKTVSSGVRSAAASISPDPDDRKDQVLWACFDKLETGPSTFKNVLLLGYVNGFQVLDVEDAANVTELVSRRDDPCTFMQIQPVPAKRQDTEGVGASHPLLLIVACDEAKGSDFMLRRDGFAETQMGNFINSGSNVRFYSMRSHNYVHVLRFRSAVYMVRCSPRIIAVGLASEIYCFDALTLENKFSVLTYPIPQPGGQGFNGINIGYGPMDVGPRWIAFAPKSPILTSTGRLSPQNLTPSPGVSPSTSPGNGSFVTRCAMESSKQLANGLINLGDMGYKTLSRYCPEILPESPNFPSNTGWKAGSSKHSSEMENAGMVVVKDVFSKAIVSQFKAHCSPISALCFDLSGTLLVTASIHGNNINIFRIMPSCSQSRSDSQSHSLTSSHVHLYKLHRGITSAGIQHICFSHCSRWVTIVSSKGTCHVYVLSPFGGESALQVQRSHADEHTVALMLSSPWWHLSSYTKTQDSCPTPPPAPVILSVVSRIRTGNSGWLNTFSNIASSAAGIASMTSSAVSAVFHSSVASGLEHSGSEANALEHLLVYSPSGHLIQYEMVPSEMGERNETAPVTGSLSMVHMQDDELWVKSVPVQWWDVCRRTDWPEKEQCIRRIAPGLNNASGLGIDNSKSEDNDTSGGKKSAVVKLKERSHGYLSDAEVQMSCGKVPLWQRSKIHFYTMNLVGPVGLNFSEESSGKEIEFETFPGHEVEVRWKDLLPVYNRSQNAQSGWSDRGYVGGKHLNVLNKSFIDEKYANDAIVYTNNKPDSPKGVPKSELGSALMPRSVLNPSQLDMFMYYQPGADSLAEKKVKQSSSTLVNVKQSSSTLVSTFSTQGPLKGDKIAVVADSCAMDISPQNACLVNTPSCLAHTIGGAEFPILKEVHSSNSVGAIEASNISFNCSNFSMNLVDEDAIKESYEDEIDFGHFFQEEYCNASPDESHDRGEVVTDVNSSSSPRNKEKSEEDMESDEILGG